MKTKAFCILLFIISAASVRAQNHKVFCDANKKYLKEEGTITNGKKEGYWKFYECFIMVSNRVSSEGLYKNDQKQGLWKLYGGATNSNLVQTVSYVDGFEEGEFTEYYLGGEIKYKGFYEKGKKKGETKEFYENGKIKGIENFETGEISLFFENGKVEETGFVKYKEYTSYRTGEWKEYYENGKLKSIGSYSSSDRTGKWEQYHDNGQLSATGIYKDRGVPLPDSWTTYDRSGQKDGLNIPEPSKLDYAMLCGDIGSKAKVSASERDYYEFWYEKRIMELAGVNIEADDEKTIKRKMQLFWNKYKTKCKCDSLTFSVPNGNFLKFALVLFMSEVIETLVAYDLDINFIDPADGLNLLDFIKLEIERLKQLENTKDSIMFYEKYRDLVIAIGGKPSKKN